MKKGPLSGVKVIEFAGIGPGPFCGMLLSDMGADVLRIDRDEKPVSNNVIEGRGKRSVKLNLKDPKDVEVCLRLIEKADILQEGFRPGVMERLGLDFKNIVENNKGVVALSLPGFCSNDEVLAPKKATEAVISAHAGIFSDPDCSHPCM